MKAFIALVALLSIVACVFFFTREKQSHAQMAALEQRIDVLSATTEQGARTEATNSALQRIILASAPSAAPTAAPTPEIAIRHTATSPQTAEEARAELDFRFMQDTPGGRWTPALQRQSESRIQAALPEGSSMLSLECHSTLCRLETEHPDRHHFEKFWGSFYEYAGPNAAFRGATSTIKVSTSPDGKGGVWATYVNIDGSSLPVLE